MGLTKQETFDKVAKHLLTQMEQSKSWIAAKVHAETPACAYRGNGGLMCAVGCLIPDEIYREGMEGKVAYSVFYDFDEVRTLFDYRDARVTDFTRLISSLQNIHDCSEPHEWKGKLCDLAFKDGLDHSVLDQFKFED